VQVCGAEVPSFTPQPQARTKLPAPSNSSIRLLAVSAMKAWPVVGSIAMPPGWESCPGPVPASPKLETGRTTAAAEVAPTTATASTVTIVRSAAKPSPVRVLEFRSCAAPTLPVAGRRTGSLSFIPWIRAAF